MTDIIFLSESKGISSILGICDLILNTVRIKKQEAYQFFILTDLEEKLLKLIDNFNSILLDAMQKNEPSIISRYLIDVSETFSTFYNNNKILCDDKEAQDARLYITYMTKVILTNGLGILGIEVPEKM